MPDQLDWGDVVEFLYEHFGDEIKKESSRQGVRAEAVLPEIVLDLLEELRIRRSLTGG